MEIDRPGKKPRQSLKIKKVEVVAGNHTGQTRGSRLDTTTMRRYDSNLALAIEGADPKMLTGSQSRPQFAQVLVSVLIAIHGFAPSIQV